MMKEPELEGFRILSSKEATEIAVNLWGGAARQMQPQIEQRRVCLLMNEAKTELRLMDFVKGSLGPNNAYDPADVKLYRFAQDGMPVRILRAFDADGGGTPS